MDASPLLLLKILGTKHINIFHWLQIRVTELADFGHLFQQNWSVERMPSMFPQ